MRTYRWGGLLPVVVTWLLLSALPAQVFASATFPCEPTGAVPLTDWPFNALNGSGWGNTASSNSTIATHASAPLSPTNVLQYRYPIGWPAGQGVGQSFYNFGNVIGPQQEIYVGFWWKASAGWQQESNSQHSKIFFLAGQTSSPNFFFGMNGATSPYHIRGTIQDGRGSLAVCNFGQIAPNCSSSNIVPNVGSVPIIPGNWYRLEAYIKFSTSKTSQNGTVRFWVNGTRIIDYTTMNMDPAVPMTSFSINSIWGGTNNTKVQEDFFYFDHAQVSRTNGGAPTGNCGAASGDTTPPAPPVNFRVTELLNLVWNFLTDLFAPSEAVA